MEKGFKKFNVWRKSDQLAYQVYLVTKGFPKEELFGLTSQLRRAAVSVPTNIAEGYGRQNRGELKHFLNIALGSISEVEYLIHFSQRIGLINANTHESLETLRNEIGRMLWVTYQNIQK